MIRILKINALDGTGGDYTYAQTFYTDIGSLTVLVTCGAVFGVYYVTAFLYLDPWHMFISYPQYLFVPSSYTNILNVYAFSNWHDISWGTKGIEATCTLPVTVITKSGAVVTEERDKPQADIDVAFEQAVKRGLKPHVKLKKRRKTDLEDSFKSFRTKLVAVYMFSNFFLCIVVMNGSFDKLKFLVSILYILLPVTQSLTNSWTWQGDSYAHKIWFFRIWMWGTPGCFILRFIGCCLFLLKSGVRWFFNKS